jgi:UPF0042 nucleotide-binding protein
MEQFRLVIISGLSGAGKTKALQCFEDIDFFCVDNLPLPLLQKFVELCLLPGREVADVALGLDTRNRDFLNASFRGIYESLREEGHFVELLFIEAKDEILIRRFSENRRPHPLGQGRAVLEGILEERRRLSELKSIAHCIIDTSEISASDLKKRITLEYGQSQQENLLHVSLVSFGFKFGVPFDLDMLFDARFLKNPFYERALQFQTGNDKSVQDFVYSLKEFEPFLEKVIDMLDYLIPLYEKEGKSYLTLGVGCTGGRHRSVSIVNKLQEVLQQQGREISCRHRDILRTSQK